MEPELLLPGPDPRWQLQIGSPPARGRVEAADLLMVSGFVS